MEANRSDVAIAKIEAVIADIAIGIEKQTSLSIPLRIKPRKPTIKQMMDGKLIEDKLVHISFPGKNPAEAKRFTILLRILELMHEALIENKVIAKRNIYYQDPELFKSQAVVDRNVDSLAYTLSLQRADLNVSAVTKGLVAGITVVTDMDGVTTRLGEDGKEYANPDGCRIICAQAPDARWILVVEKESTFRTLVSHALHLEQKPGPGLIVTAKGYPDLSTHSFLHCLSIPTSMPSSIQPKQIPIFVIVDYDPYGIGILSVYKYGSKRLAHEEKKRLPSVRWLGLRNADIKNNIMNDEGGLLKLTKQDRKQAASMLATNEVLGEDGKEGEWRRELQVMLMLGVKAEMEILERHAKMGDAIKQALGDLSSQD